MALHATNYWNLITSLPFSGSVAMLLVPVLAGIHTFVLVILTVSFNTGKYWLTWLNITEDCSYN
jgi:hypothetical protein